MEFRILAENYVKDGKYVGIFEVFLNSLGFKWRLFLKSSCHTASKITALYEYLSFFPDVINTVLLLLFVPTLYLII